jgi:thiamine-phosphate pyrophosphorylase
VTMADDIDRKLADKRVVQRYLKKGQLDGKEYEKHLKSLPDLALLSGADGVHLGDEDLPVAEARAILGGALLVGRTARGAEEARAALAEGADHVGYGPVFPSATKPLDVAPRGLEALAAACAAVPAPLVAISGIALENIGAVAYAGAAAVAVIGDLFERGDPRARAEALAAAFARGAGSGKRVA